MNIRSNGKSPSSPILDPFGNKLVLLGLSNSGFENISILLITPCMCLIIVNLTGKKINKNKHEMY
jgi:hypothetical protein